MPKPGQANDAASWLLRAEECSKPSQHLAIAQAIFGTLSDCYLLVIPIQSIFQLKLPTERKVGVSTIFLVGIMFVYASASSEMRNKSILMNLQRYRVLPRLPWLPHQASQCD